MKAYLEFWCKIVFWERLNHYHKKNLNLGIPHQTGPQYLPPLSEKTETGYPPLLVINHKLATITVSLSCVYHYPLTIQGNMQFTTSWFSNVQDRCLQAFSLIFFKFFMIIIYFIRLSFGPSACNPFWQALLPPPPPPDMQCPN